MTPSNRVDRYRKRAEEARIKAEMIKSPSVRASLLENAETWDRMADQEERRNQRPQSTAN